MRFHFGCACSKPWIPLALPSFMRGSNFECDVRPPVEMPVLTSKALPIDENSKANSRDILPPPPPPDSPPPPLFPAHLFPSLNPPRDPSTSVPQAHTLDILASVPSTDSSRLLIPQAARYVAFCRELLVDPDPDVLIALQLHTKVLRIAKLVSKSALLPMGKILETDTVITTLDLSSVRIEDSGAYVIANMLTHNRSLTHVNLRGSGIGPEGARALADALRVNDTLQALELRSNHPLGPEGALSIFQALAAKGPHLRPFTLDLSDCRVGFEGVEVLMHSVSEQPAALTLLTDGNFMREEILNVLSHGFGCILCVVGSAVLLRQENVSLLDFYSKLVYCICLFCLYLASTISHSLHSNNLPWLTDLFKVLDHCSIYLLIAGTYTPLMVITMGHTPVGFGLCFAQWLCALVGIVGHLNGLPSVLELLLYASMGWMIAPFIPTLRRNIDPIGFDLVALGGVLYTTGIYFYSVGKKKPVYHVVWHFFVLAGSLVHYLAILWYLHAPKQTGPSGEGWRGTPLPALSLDL